MTWTPEQLAKVKRLQAAAHARDPGFGQRMLRLLNQATLEAKSKMTPEAIAREEESRRRYGLAEKEREEQALAARIWRETA